MIDKMKVYQDTELSSKAVSVYLYLCERAIQELERSAYIKKENRFRDNGGKSSNLYFIE